MPYSLVLFSIEEVEISVNLKNSHLNRDNGIISFLMPFQLHFLQMQMNLEDAELDLISRN